MRATIACVASVFLTAVVPQYHVLVFLSSYQFATEYNLFVCFQLTNLVEDNVAVYMNLRIECFSAVQFVDLPPPECGPTV